MKGSKKGNCETYECKYPGKCFKLYISSIAALEVFYPFLPVIQLRSNHFDHHKLILRWVPTLHSHISFPSPSPKQGKTNTEKPQTPLPPCPKRMGCIFSMPSSYRRQKAWHKIRKQQWENHLLDEERYYQEQWNRYRHARADGTTLTNEGVDYSGGRRRRIRFELD